MQKINDGGPAFPIANELEVIAAGMSLRDYFAAKAMHGFVPLWVNSKDNMAVLSETAYKLADAMLAVREVK